MNHQSIPVVVCVNCLEKLWFVSLASDGKITFCPCRRDICFFNPGTNQCPLCSQEYSLSVLGPEILIRDEYDGHIKQALLDLDMDLERKAA